MAAKDTLLESLQHAAGSVVLDIDEGTLRAPLTARRFSTGSAGFSWQGKVDGADGRRYQVNVTAVVIGSKDSAP